MNNGVSTESNETPFTVHEEEDGDEELKVEYIANDLHPMVTPMPKTSLIGVPSDSVQSEYEQAQSEQLQTVTFGDVVKRVTLNSDHKEIVDEIDKIRKMTILSVAEELDLDIDDEKLHNTEMMRMPTVDSPAGTPIASGNTTPIDTDDNENNHNS